MTLVELLLFLPITVVVLGLVTVPAELLAPVLHVKAIILVVVIVALFALLVRIFFKMKTLETVSWASCILFVAVASVALAGLDPQPPLYMPALFSMGVAAFLMFGVQISAFVWRRVKKSSR